MSILYDRYFALGLGWASSSSQSYALDNAFTYETSGKSVCSRFLSTKSQTSAAFKVYARLGASNTGSPTSLTCDIYNGYNGTGDSDRPESGGSPIATTTANPSGLVTNEWITFTFSSVTLSLNTVYFIIIHNTSTTPASNYSTICYTAPIQPMLNASYRYAFAGGYNADGYTTDPTTGTNMGAFILEFADGDTLGIAATTSITHASNTNYRGIRVQFSEDIVIFGSTPLTYGTACSHFKIYSTSGTELLSQALAEPMKYQTGYLDCVFSPFTLTGGTSYDLVWAFSTSSTVFNYSNFGAGTPPTAVANSYPNWYLGYVDGATPGSCTPDLTKLPTAIILFIRDMPAISSSGGGLLTHPGMSGGARG